MDAPNGETYLKDMMEWKPETDDDKTLAERSEIVDFFDGCNVLITGGSGFMGKLLVEKLLRTHCILCVNMYNPRRWGHANGSRACRKGFDYNVPGNHPIDETMVSFISINRYRTCWKLQKLYLLMRAKKGKTSEERYKEHFEDPVYDRLKRERPDFSKQVVMIEGRMEENGLGLTPESREILLNSHVVFHGAATVRFDETLRFAVNVNVRGTREILILSRQMPNLKAFVHIGTAFSQCVTKVIDEIFYTPPIDGDKLLHLLDILDDEQLKMITPSMVGNWPNTYAFTKAVAEDIVRRYSTQLPTCIVRPSIMIATHKEPIVGWINNLYGPTGVVVGAGIGLLRSLHCNKKNVADIIPADYVINNIIAAAWDTAMTQKLVVDKNASFPPKLPDGKDPPIYNSVSSCQNPVTWGEFMKWNEIYGMAVPSTLVLWYYSFSLNKHLWLHNLFVILFHLVPAAIVDSLAWLTGRKPMLMSAYKKIHKFSGVISYFSTQQWTFRNETVMRLWDKLNPADRQLFEFNVANLVWRDYFFYHIRGLRLFIIKDPLETLPQGRARHGKLKVAHYTLMTLLSCLLIWLVYNAVRYIFSAFW